MTTTVLQPGGAVVGGDAVTRADTVMVGVASMVMLAGTSAAAVVVDARTGARLACTAVAAAAVGVVMVTVMVMEPALTATSTALTSTPAAAAKFAAIAPRAASGKVSTVPAHTIETTFVQMGGGAGVGGGGGV